MLEIIYYSLAGYYSMALGGLSDKIGTIGCSGISSIFYLLFTDCFAYKRVILPLGFVCFFVLFFSDNDSLLNEICEISTNY